MSWAHEVTLRPVNPASDASATNRKASSGATKRVVLFTNDTSPLSAGGDGSTAVERAHLLQQMGIFIHVVALSTPTHPGWAFYKVRSAGRCTRGLSPWVECLLTPIAPCPTAHPQRPGHALGRPLRGPVRHADSRLPRKPKAHTPQTNRLDALQERVRQRIHKKRRLTSLELYISPSNPVGLPGSVETAPMRMAVGLYSLVMQATKPTPERVDKLQNRPLRTMSKFLSRGSFIQFNPREPNTRQTRRLPYGGTTLDFSPQEAADLRAGPGQPGLALLGFKPAASLRDDDQLRSSWFLHPEEAQRPGSTVAFTALLAAMLRARVVAICLLTRSSKTPPRLVALLPQGPEVEMRQQAGGGETAVMTSQPGMHVLCLPFRDDIRLGIEDAVLPYAVAPPPTEEAARAAAAVVDGVKLADFASEGVTNPKLQHFYTKLEEFAIDADDIVMDSIAPEAPHEVTLDGTLPDVGNFNAAVLEAFSAALGGLDPGAQSAAAPKAGTKRKAAELDPEAEEKAGEVVRLAEAGKLATATVDQLKMYCRAHGLTVGGKKAELVARVEKYMEGG